jgi:hypothetical protein
VDLNQDGHVEKGEFEKWLYQLLKGSAADFSDLQGYFEAFKLTSTREYVRRTDVTSIYTELETFLTCGSNAGKLSDRLKMILAVNKKILLLIKGTNSAAVPDSFADWQTGYNLMLKMINAKFVTNKKVVFGRWHHLTRHYGREPAP